MEGSIHDEMVMDTILCIFYVDNHKCSEFLSSFNS